jgi:hypothetical protein
VPVSEEKKTFYNYICIFVQKKKRSILTGYLYSYAVGHIKVVVDIWGENEDVLEPETSQFHWGIGKVRRISRIVTYDLQPSMKEFLGQSYFVDFLYVVSEDRVKGILLRLTNQ